MSEMLRRGLMKGKKYKLVQYLYCPNTVYAHTGCVTTIPFDNSGQYEVRISAPTYQLEDMSYIKLMMCSMKESDDVPLNGIAYNYKNATFYYYAQYGASSAGSFNIENIGVLNIKLTCSPVALYVCDESGANILHENKYWADIKQQEGHICLMGGGIYSSTAWKGYFYEAKAFHSNGELYAHFLPCIRMIDNKVGFYESITGQFFEILHAEGFPIRVFAGPSI